ncbi:hypothetical protein [Kineosporia sp. NBRC 101731]|uniref:hypothetical protein n=1 Tax=Kineosporia sp. NBRC 101731 TaxID=3032199 RepID=UPI0025524E00|nr:hypothetical protein [Kineosporia sp. NBRC 101731]
MRALRLTVAVAAGVVALGAAGFAAYPAFADDTPGPGSSVGAAPVPGPDRIKDALKGLVDDGTITQDQADKVAEKLADSQGPRRGQAGRGFGGGPGGGFGGGFGVAQDELAKALGLSTDDLRSALADGTSVKELAQKQGKDLDDVIDALVTAATAKIDQAVTDGKLSQDRADELKPKLKERITALIEKGGPRGHVRGGQSRSGDDEQRDEGTPAPSAPAPSAPARPQNSDTSFL